MKQRGYVAAAVVSLLAVGCYTGDEELAPPVPGQDTTAPVTVNVAAGALVYDNWLSLLAGGTGTSLLPDEPVDAYVQCVSCHGWDRLGEGGGHARKLRISASPNAGYLVVGDTLGSRRIDGSSYTDLTITHDAASGRLWAQGSLIYDPAVSTSIVTGNRHPDYTQERGLTPTQLSDLQAFMSDTSRTWNTVFSRINPITVPVGYTVVSTAATSSAVGPGQSFYLTNCSSCHGADARVLAPVLESDGGHSHFMFRALWGSANVSGKTHESMGSPRPLDVANVMVYVNTFVSGNSTSGGTFWSSYGCGTCHDATNIPDPANVYANLFYLNNRHKTQFKTQQRYLTEQEVANLRAHIRTL